MYVCVHQHPVNRTLQEQQQLYCHQLLNQEQQITQCLQLQEQQGPHCPQIQEQQQRPHCLQSKAVATPLSTASRAVANPLSTTRRASPVQTLTAASRLARQFRRHMTHLGSTERPKRRHFEGSLHQNFRDWSQQNIFFLNNYIDFTKCLSLNF